MKLKSIFLATTAAIVSFGAFAEEARVPKVDGKPIIDLRLRAEQVDQDGLDETTALTLRGRMGYEAKFAQGWSALVEAEGVVQLNDDFSDTVDVVPGKAVIADPETLELNRLQVAWQGEKSSATIGRQRIIFDNARFVGNVGFRQNEQTFDAVRLGHKVNDSVSVDYVYIDGVRRIFGDDHPMGEFESDSHVLRIATKSEMGDIVLTALLLDFENAPGASSQTYAMRWTNAWDTPAGKLGGHVELARQSDYQGYGPTEDLGYQAYGLTLQNNGLTAMAGVDILEGSSGQGFATPLATLHAFQGWADVFLNTPGAGLRDVSLGVKGKGRALFKDAKPLSWAVIYHDFDSDNGALSYGSEFDAVVRVPLNDRFSVEAKGAVFEGGVGGPADRTKFWLALQANF